MLIEFTMLSFRKVITTDGAESTINKSTTAPSSFLDTALPPAISGWQCRLTVDPPRRHLPTLVTGTTIFTLTKHWFPLCLKPINRLWVLLRRSLTSRTGDLGIVLQIILTWPLLRSIFIYNISCWTLIHSSKEARRFLSIPKTPNYVHSKTQFMWFDQMNWLTKLSLKLTSVSSCI